MKDGEVTKTPQRIQDQKLKERSTSAGRHKNSVHSRLARRHENSVLKIIRKVIMMF